MKTGYGKNIHQNTEKNYIEVWKKYTLEYGKRCKSTIKSTGKCEDNFKLLNIFYWLTFFLNISNFIEKSAQLFYLLHQKTKIDAINMAQMLDLLH